MMNPTSTSTSTNFNTPLADGANHLADQAVQGVESARRSTQRFVSEAEQLARRGMSAVLDGSSQLRDKAQRAQDSTVGYIKDEPFKAVLIAAATGAALMAMVALFSRSRSSRD